MFLSLLAFALAAPVPPGNPVYLPPNLYLVRVVTQNVWKDADKPFNRGTLKITAVVAGPARLLGQKFEANTRDQYAEEAFGTRAAPRPLPVNHVIPILERGAEGLWWVTEDPKEKLSPELRLEVIRRYRLAGFPYQNTKANPNALFGGPPVKELWKEGEVWATAVAAVYAARTDTDRRALLEVYAATERSPVAGWAMGWLTRGGSAEPTARFLGGLVGNDKLSLPSQLALDECLCRLDAAGWATSADRRALLGRWLDTTSADPDRFVYPCQRLEDALAAGEIDGRTFAAVVGVTARCKELTKSQVFFLRRLLASAKFKKADEAVGRAFLTEVQQSAPVEALRYGAEEGLKQFTRP